ncbi:F-box/WD repeat-containing protein 9-like [Temnothorax longispinosus]|uniref:F-box/WD repeat-containing protein 9-like n=1 Tax=Temnothorax longispinosus TaxID=300112 RepID=UPI003A9A37F7
MNNENARCAYDGEENAQLSPLQRLPVEIFLHICSFLDGSTLHGLSLVCTRFYLILKDANSLWKAQINHIWPYASWLLCPARPDKLSWMSSYVAIKQETALWKQQESRKKRLFIKKMPADEIDAVLLMHVNGISHLVYAFGQDLRYTQLPSREKLSHEIENSGDIAKPHQWSRIMGLTAINNTIYSCGADNTVRSWVLTNTGLIHQRIYDLRRSDNFHSFLWRISSCPEDNLFATGSSCGTIYVFDSRSRNNPIRHYRPHTKPVNSLAMNTEYILSATANDYTMSIWDQRAGRTMKSITFPGVTYPTVPTCINMQRDLVFVGTMSRDTWFSFDPLKLHVLNPKDDFKIVKSYSTKHTGNITGVHLTHGCLITSSRDGTVKISSLTDPSKPIATLRSEMRHISDVVENRRSRERETEFKLSMTSRDALRHVT